MENFKELHPIEKEKDRSIFKKLRKKALVITLSSLALLGPAVKPLESAFGKVKPLKENVELKIQKSIFEEEAPEKTVDKLNYIVKAISILAATQLGCSWKDIYNLDNPDSNKKFIEILNQESKIKSEVQKDSKGPLVSEDLEEIGLEPKIIREVLKTFPPSWVKEVASITYLNKSISVGLNEETGEGASLIAHHQSKGKEALSEIHFFQGAKGQRADRLLFRLIYEFGHANNWRNRCNLSLAQRISLLYEVIKQVESLDRYRDKYVESIKCVDKAEEIARKAVEYWGALCMWVIAKPGNNPIPESGRKLVLDYLKITDPKFNIVKSANSREMIIMAYLEKTEAQENEKST